MGGVMQSRFVGPREGWEYLIERLKLDGYYIIEKEFGVKFYDIDNNKNHYNSVWAEIIDENVHTIKIDFIWYVPTSDPDWEWMLDLMVLVEKYLKEKGLVCSIQDSPAEAQRCFEPKRKRIRFFRRLFGKS